MTIEQASERFAVPLDKLQFYEKQGLFDCHKQPDGMVDYNDESDGLSGNYQCADGCWCRSGHAAKFHGAAHAKQDHEG